MADIKGQHPEFLDRRGCQASPVVRPNIGSIAKKPAALWPGTGHSTAKLDGCLDDGCTRRPHPRQGAQFGFRALGNAAQVTGVGKQIMSNFHHILPLTTRTEEDSQELGVRKAGSTTGKEAFARTIFRSQGE
jgi:hypothetical protein